VKLTPGVVVVVLDGVHIFAGVVVVVALNDVVVVVVVVVALADGVHFLAGVVVVELDLVVSVVVVTEGVDFLARVVVVVMSFVVCWWSCCTSSRTTFRRWNCCRCIENFNRGCCRQVAVVG